MKPLSIPPFYRCYVFACQSVLFVGTAVRIVYASDLTHAVQYMENWRTEQGIDYQFNFIAEVSGEDIHICESEYVNAAKLF